MYDFKCVQFIGSTSLLRRTSQHQVGRDLCGSHLGVQECVQIVKWNHNNWQPLNRECRTIYDDRWVIIFFIMHQLPKIIVEKIETAFLQLFMTLIVRIPNSHPSYW